MDWDLDEDTVQRQVHVGERFEIGVSHLKGNVDTYRDFADPSSRYLTGEVRETWRVQLPHQCDEWTVALENGAGGHARAVGALEAFIAEAQEALTALRGMGEFE